MSLSINDANHKKIIFDILVSNIEQHNIPTSIHCFLEIVKNYSEFCTEVFYKNILNNCPYLFEYVDESFKTYEMCKYMFYIYKTLKNDLNALNFNFVCNDNPFNWIPLKFRTHKLYLFLFTCLITQI